MNASRNETRLEGASGFRESAKLNVKRWSERFLTALDELTTAALWCVCGATVVRCALVPSERVAASTLVFLTFATISVYALRETVWVWRESPCRLPKSEFRARVWSASLPLWATAAVVAAALGASGDAWACVISWAAVFYVLCVDLGAARFARRWGATVARDWRLALEDDTTSSNAGATTDVGVTLEKAVVCVEANAAPNVALEEANAEFEDAADGEILATQRRVRAEDGKTEIFGSVAVEFEADAEVAPVFVAFCPPFEGLPSFDFEQIAGPEIVVKATSVQPFGVRLEAKRKIAQTQESQGFANSEKIRIEYFASFPPFDETEESAF